MVFGLALIFIFMVLDYDFGMENLNDADLRIAEKFNEFMNVKGRIFFDKTYLFREK